MERKRTTVLWDSKCVTVALGLALVLAPFVVGYSNNPTALWTSLILGWIVTILGNINESAAAATVGVVIVVAPWVLGFSAVSGALWICVLVGGADALVAGYRAIIEHRSETVQVGGTPQHQL